MKNNETMLVPIVLYKWFWHSKDTGITERGEMSVIKKSWNTSDCNTAVEFQSIYVERVLFDIGDSVPSRIKDSWHSWHYKGIDEF